MATSTAKYPKLPEEIENEKEIVESLKALTPLPIKIKGFALNHYSLKIKQYGAQNEEEIDTLNIGVQKGFQDKLKHINDMITGARVPTEEELKAFEEYLTDEEKGQKDTILANLKPLPEYWAKVLQADPMIKTHINDNGDENALKHLTKVEYKYSEDAATPHNFTVTWHFSPNEYFENEVLSTTFTMREPRDVLKTEGTEIKWKEGKNFTKKSVTKKQKNKKTGQTRSVTKEEDVPSIFLFFKSVVAPEEDKELDEDEEQLQNEILDQMDIAYSLIEEAIPFSLEYYLGVRKDYMGGFGEEDDYEDGDDDDDDDDEEEDEAPKGKKGGKTQGAAPGGAAGQKQECKQQ